MTLTPDTKLGPYEIVALIGAGGRGEVYRARDARLGRDVAVKVLPTSFAADPERLRRFEQEARAVAALSHPNILALHDIGQHDRAPFLVSDIGGVFADPPLVTRDGASFAFDYRLRLSDLYTVTGIQ